jgi:hypothetical protein
MKKAIFAALVGVSLLAVAPANAQAISSQDLFNLQVNNVSEQTALAVSVALSGAGKAKSEASATNIGNLFDTNVDSKAISNVFAGSFQDVANVQVNVGDSQIAVAGSLAASAGNARSVANAINGGNIASSVISSVAKK